MHPNNNTQLNSPVLSISALWSILFHVKSEHVIANDLLVWRKKTAVGTKHPAKTHARESTH